jgi:hypothetical protein
MEITIAEDQDWFVYNTPYRKQDMTFVNDRIVLERFTDGTTDVSYYKDKNGYSFYCLDLFTLSEHILTITQEEIDIYLTFQ